MPKYNDSEVHKFPILPKGTFRFKVEELVHTKTVSGTPRTMIVVQVRAVEPKVAVGLSARTNFVLGTDRDPEGASSETKATSVAWRRWREFRDACDVSSLGSTEEEQVALAGREFAADITREVRRRDKSNPESELIAYNEFRRYYKLGTVQLRVDEVITEDADRSPHTPGATIAAARRAALDTDEE